MGVDYVKEIRRVWGIDPSVVELSFREDAKLMPPNPTTNANCVDGRLKTETIAPDASDYKTIVFHEGAHIYLLALNYPLIRIAPDRYSPFNCYDWLNEYYAIGLEIMKMNPGNYERVQEIKQQMIDIERKPTYDRIALAAIYERIVAELGEPTEQIRVISDGKLEGAPDYQAWFFLILSSLQNVPPIPSRRISEEESEKMFSLVKTMCSSLYSKGCSVERTRCDGRA